MSLCARVGPAAGRARLSIRANGLLLAAENFLFPLRSKKKERIARHPQSDSGWWWMIRAVQGGAEADVGPVPEYWYSIQS